MNKIKPINHGPAYEGGRHVVKKITHNAQNADLAVRIKSRIIDERKTIIDQSLKGIDLKLAQALELGWVAVDCVQYDYKTGFYYLPIVKRRAV